jgi:hypothetical protein
MVNPLNPQILQLCFANSLTPVLLYAMYFDNMVPRVVLQELHVLVPKINHDQGLNGIAFVNQVYLYLHECSSCACKRVSPCTFCCS